MQTPDVTVDPALARLYRGSFAKELCRSVRAYVKRRGMSATAFGWAAMDDPSFVPRLRNGRRVKLCTADQVRRFVGEQTFRQMLVCEIREFLAVSRIKGWVAGDWAIQQRAFIERLFGGASPLLMTIDRFRRWMHAQLQPAEREAVLMAVARELAAEPARRNGQEAAAGLSGREGEERMSRNSRLLTTDEAAAWLGLSTRTLERLRATGEGPKYSKLGRWVRYSIADLEAWIGSRTRSSTSEDGDDEDDGNG